MQFDWSEKCR
jgi:hypothetical protein